MTQSSSGLPSGQRPSLMECASSSLDPSSPVSGTADPGLVASRLLQLKYKPAKGSVSSTPRHGHPFDTGHATADTVQWSLRPKSASHLLGHPGLAAVLAPLTSAIFETGVIKCTRWVLRKVMHICKE